MEKTQCKQITVSSRCSRTDLDIKSIRTNARKHVEEGAQTASYRGNVDEIIKLLNHSLATELVCVLRYKRHCCPVPLAYTLSRLPMNSMCMRKKN